MLAFVFVVLFAALFLASWLPGIYDKPYGKTIGTVAQAGMALSLIVLFLFRGKRKIPPSRNNRDEAN